MNLILLFDSDFVSDDRVQLRGRRLKHVLEVLRVAEGDQLVVGRCGGAVGTGTITQLSSDALDLHVVLDREPPPPAALTLLMSLPRPSVLSRVIASLTSFGVKRIFLMNSWRVEKSFWHSARLSEESLHEYLVEGLEQAKDTVLPSIEFRRRFRPFVEDELPAIAAGSLALVAHPAAERECPSMVSGPVTLAIGPEGGFIPSEIEMFERSGLEAVRYGERILRVEPVIPALLGRLGF